ncbi:MAG: hypothetical protein FWG21_03170 [Oscillospiraceae bacterium]|nr:hypothetical protein [Oscillospiraceae bacterium]
MIEKERSSNNNRRPGFNVGSASIIMVFAVLCLTIFSVLSFTTSSSDLRLSHRAAKSISDYYQAEYRAQDKIILMHQQLLKEGNLDSLRIQSGQTDLSSREFSLQFTEPVDDRRMLLVELYFDSDNNITISRWNLLAASDWIPDQSMEVWSGN